MTLLSEAALLVLTLKIGILGISENKLVRTPVDLPIFLFVLWGILSALVNSQHMVTTFIGFRFDLKFVLMFLLLVNLNPDEQFFRRMSRLLILLLLIQVPVALVKYTIYGQGEGAVGTYSYHTGTHSTILPLIGISIFMGFFFFEKPRLRYVIFFLLFILFSIIGGKRAFVFLGFLLFLFLFWNVGRKKLKRLSLVTPFFILGFLACIYFVPSLRPTFQNPRHLMDYTVSYSTSYSAESGKASGRASSLKEAYNMLKSKPLNLVLGFGPGSMSESYFKEYEGKLRSQAPIEYGMSQWVITSLEYGYIGAFLLLWVLTTLLRRNQKFFNTTEDKYWKSISFGFKGIWFTFLMGFFYCAIFRADLAAFIFWFFAAAICSLEKQRNVQGKELYHGT